MTPRIIPFPQSLNEAAFSTLDPRSIAFRPSAGMRRSARYRQVRLLS